MPKFCCQVHCAFFIEGLGMLITPSHAPMDFVSGTEVEVRPPTGQPYRLRLRHLNPVMDGWVNGRPAWAFDTFDPELRLDLPAGTELWLPDES